MVEVLNEIAADITNERNDKVRGIISSFNEFVAQLKEVASIPADNDPDNKRASYVAVIEYKINEIRVWLEPDSALKYYDAISSHYEPLDKLINKFRAITEVDVTSYSNALERIEELYGRNISDAERPEWLGKILNAGAKPAADRPR